jgi:hypothetical protein
MSDSQAARIHRFLESVNRDIGQELKTASVFLSLAESVCDSSVRFVGAQYLGIGSAAMRHATALAAEVLAVGGHPPAGGAQPARPACHSSTRQQVAILARATRRYLRRRRSAQTLGLLGLAEVFRSMTQTWRRQLGQILLLASEGGVSAAYVCGAPPVRLNRKDVPPDTL